MNKAIPLWVLLLCLLICSLFTVAFGWSIKSTLSGSDLSGSFGKSAVMIASFPTTVKFVFTETKVDAVDKGAYYRIPRSNDDLSDFTAIKAIPGINISGLMMRADRAALSDNPGWRILVGVFTIDGELKNAALALSPDLVITNLWLLTEEEIDGKEWRPPHRKFVHGFDIMNDGSVVVSFDGGISLQRFNQCGSRLWAVGGGYHHAVTLDDSQDYVWTLLESSLVKIATANGEITQRLSMDEIIAANPMIDFLEIHVSPPGNNDQKVNNNNGGSKRNWKSPVERWQGEEGYDHFHFNDVDPLPAELAIYYDDFEAGDLLVSARSLNLVFVVDPDTLEVKWWRTGATRRQHDPDWGWNGEISIFDNRRNRGYSHITSINPESFRTSIVFDGRSNDFYSHSRGKHQITENGTLLITSSQQGRIFEVTSDGEIILEVINTIPGSSEHNYIMSEAIWRAPDTLSFTTEKMLCAN